MSDPPPPVPPLPQLSQATARGLNWALVAAEIQRDLEKAKASPPKPVKPFTPVVVKTTPAGDTVILTDESEEPLVAVSPWFLRWVC